MASFTFMSLQLQQQREQLNPFSFSLSRYRPSLKTSNVHFFSRFLASLPLKTSHERRFHHNFLIKSLASVPKFSTLERRTSENTKSVEQGKEIRHGYSSANSMDKRVSKNAVKDHVDSAVEKKSEKRLSRRTRETPSYRETKRTDPRHSSQSSKVKSLEASGNYRVSEKIEKKDSENQVVKGKKKKSKKGNDSPEVKLKVALDQCSKTGDVMEALSLYDNAQRKGIKLGQHNYTVLLYLCSSAAVGVVQPAKSGSGSRTSGRLALPKEVVNPLEFRELADTNERELSGSKSSNTMMDDLVSDNERLVDTVHSNETVNRTELNSNVNMNKSSNGFLRQNTHPRKEGDEISVDQDIEYSQEDHKILVSEDFKKYALKRGFEIYENMRQEGVPMNEAALTSVARIAMSVGDGDMAFEMVKQMKMLGINPRLRSYDPALFAFCNNGDVDKAFSVEKQMLEDGVIPEEPELESLLRVSILAGKTDKVYYVLHKLRTTVREVSSSTADMIISWFKSKQASKVGKRKWDKRLMKEIIANNGGGWHGQGWLGKGQWKVFHTTIGTDGMCKCCGVHLATIDLDPIETEKFADSVASIAIMRERKSNFQKFQKWLDYYGPFEAVVDAANVGLFSQRRFMPSKINVVVNGIRHKLPSKRYPLIILHNKRITGHKMYEPFNKELIEKWKNADALYATPTGSNDDWYWLYAAIKFRCLIVTNDEMRDHLFQLLGNDIFPKWKERHQVHFSFSDTGPEFHLPPPCSVVIQESEEGHWHIPVKSEEDFKSERRWLCITRGKSDKASENCSKRSEESAPEAASAEELHVNHDNHKGEREEHRKMYTSLRDIFSASVSLESDHRTLLTEIEEAEFLGGCTIDFQI
ncbi:proteinaceous RNase P 1, chloroplastic/mitochondrial-like isoform X2 [Prosopis cineraria]|uniref:proteinaceous RNase P 1, chloroplastic/mitochondrial-like isoform X2 n=1 Tax=Prosopis cineraria TaxID=364024 RepID=UPI00240EEDB3|nr:proteinaceous RNase P 1, chloroplastic/mitochondrial-like isoform X2 [Prosopis cineraria]